MNTNLCWTASSKTFEKQHDHDLTMLAGQWCASLQVTITRPEVIKRGPIMKSEIETINQYF